MVNHNKMRTIDNSLRTKSKNLGSSDLSLRPSSELASFTHRNIPVSMKNNPWSNFNKSGLLIIFGLAVIIYVAIFSTLLQRNGMIRALAAGAGGWLSTMVAFRWIWGRRSEWERYFVSIRPMFQTISFLYIVLGPLPPLMGMPQYLFNYGVKDFYWVLYLASPLAFLAYEFGFERGIGRQWSKIKLPDLQKDFNFPGSLMFITFAIVIAIYYYMSRYVGFYGGGFKNAYFETEGEFVKLCGFLFHGFAAVTILLAFNNYGKRGLFYRLCSSIAVVSVILFVTFMHNRRMAIIFVILCISLMQMMWKLKFLKTFILSVVPIIAIYAITTGIRTTMPSEYDRPGAAFTEKLALSKEVLASAGTKNKIERNFMVDVGYHLDSFDESAAIIKNHEIQGIPYMWGEHFFDGVYQSVPAMLGATDKIDPEEGIILHFDLVLFDQCSTLFATGIADGGILGIPIVFLVVGLMHAYLWRYWSEGKISSLIDWGAKCSSFAMIPYLLAYETFLGVYLAVNFRYWVIFTIIFTLILGCYSIMSPNNSMDKRKLALNN